MADQTLKEIEGGVCAAQGFKANGVHAGLYDNINKKDLALVVSDRICDVSAVYTTNKVKGAPILVTKEHLAASGNKAMAVVVNSRNANTCNADGRQKAEKVCELAAKELGIDKNLVLPASTGVIGQTLPLAPFESHMAELAAGLDYHGNKQAAQAIMTTDTIEKEAAVEFELSGVICHLGGMAKGSGMIHPNMATTLNFITTDAAIDASLLEAALKEIVQVTYNCLSIDGDTSTNDMVCLMANGMAGNPRVVEENEDYKMFKCALYNIMERLTRMLAKDGEGATKLLECSCVGAPSQDAAIAIAKSVIRSPLLKCAMFGEDANWGRILCAIGYAEAEFDIMKVDVDLASRAGRIEVCRQGAGLEFSEEKAKEILQEDEIMIDINLNQGMGKAKAWGCDLTYEYVKINGDYRS